MKKIILITCFWLSCIIALPQQKDKSGAGEKNMVKLNLFALGIKNISFQYERAIAKKISLAAGFRLMPKGDIPLKGTIKNIVNDPETERQINNFNTGNIAFTPELRFYLSRKNVFRGFYIAPYARIARYTAELPYEYDDGGVTKTILLSGSVNTFTGGLLFGAQWKLGKQIYLDWWLFGPNYGSSDGTIDGKKSLNILEQQSLRDELSKLDIPLTNITYTVDANGATVNFNGPWAGIRSGLCLGFRF